MVRVVSLRHRLWHGFLKREFVRVALSCVVAWALSAGCSSAPSEDTTTFPPQETGEFHILEEGPGGFTLAVNYRRYQFVPDSAVVANACRTSLTVIARELADLRGHKLQPIDEQSMQLTVGLDNATSMTTCSATIPVKFVD